MWIGGRVPQDGCDERADSSHRETGLPGGGKLAKESWVSRQVIQGLSTPARTVCL